MKRSLSLRFDVETHGGPEVSERELQDAMEAAARSLLVLPHVRSVTPADSPANDDDAGDDDADA